MRRVTRRPPAINSPSSVQADARLALADKNTLASGEKETLFDKVVSQLKEPLILMLLVSAVVSFVMKQYDDAICITGAIILVCLVGGIQEFNSEKTIEALKSLVTHSCRVIRGGVYTVVQAEDLVVGDLVSIETGDRVPADLRLVDVNQFMLDESVLTGESDALSKSIVAVATDAPLHDRVGMAYMGTVSVSGNAKGLVVRTGNDTELGKIASLVDDDDDDSSPLQKNMNQLGQSLSIFSMGIIAVICVFGVFIQGSSWLEMFTTGVSLAVAAIPEGLPIVVTVTLALGCQRMAKRKALIRRLPAVEALGATSVVCVDKTGTLTQNKMTVRKLFVAADNATIEVPSGAKAPERMTNALEELLRAGMLCNNAASAEIGTPTERALLNCALNAGLIDMRPTWKRTHEDPFTTETKRMLVTYNVPEQGEVTFVKGSEAVIDSCDLDAASKAKYLKLSDSMSAEGLRVLTVAKGTPSKLTFIGLIAINDPPRLGVGEAIRSIAVNSGIKTVMITGDARPTAEAIGKELNILTAGSNGSTTGRSMSGAEVEQLSVQELADVIENVCIFYRATPSVKRRLVEAYKAKGHVVAMTGDGVNDAPALKKADVGIALGSGQDVAKEASEMILVDDNFSTIVAAIEEGRSIFANIRKFILFQLTTSAAAMSIIATCTMLDLPLPLTPTQILLINVIMDGPPAQSLGVEAPEEDTMRLPPRDPKAAVVSRQIIVSVFLSAVLMVISVVGIFADALKTGTEAHAATVAFTTFVLFQVFNAINCKSHYLSIIHMDFATNRLFLYAIGGCICAQIAVVHVPFISYIFETEPLTLREWVTSAAIASSVIVLSEVRKHFLRVSEGRSSHRRKLVNAARRKNLGKATPNITN